MECYDSLGWPERAAESAYEGNDGIGGSLDFQGEGRGWTAPG